MCVLSQCVYKNTVTLTLHKSRDPVFGCDGVTLKYSNECEAYAGGHNIDYKGSCQEVEVLKSS